MSVNKYETMLHFRKVMTLGYQNGAKGAHWLIRVRKMPQLEKRPNSCEEFPLRHVLLNESSISVLKKILKIDQRPTLNHQPVSF